MGALSSVPAGAWVMSSNFSPPHRNGGKSIRDPREQDALQPGLLLAGAVSEASTPHTYMDNAFCDCGGVTWSLNSAMCLSTHRSSVQPLLFSRSGARKGPHWLPRDSTLPNLWATVVISGRPVSPTESPVYPGLERPQTTDTRPTSLALSTCQHLPGCSSSALCSWPPNPSDLSGPGKQDLPESAHEESLPGTFMFATGLAALGLPVHCPSASLAGALGSLASLEDDG